MNFFEKFDRFYTTSQTSPFPHRLNGRHEAIIARNADLLANKRVLDIASHDGRWTFAALQAGAAHVVGIEPRQELIANALKTFAHYGVDPARFEFICGDVFNLISGMKFDVVLCLGFYYHTIRHAELLDLIDRTEARFVVIDTEVTPGISELPMAARDASIDGDPKNPPLEVSWIRQKLERLSPRFRRYDPRLVYKNPYNVQLLRDPVSDQQMAWQDTLTRDGYTLVGRPSRAAVQFMANHFGYACELYDWPSHFVSNPRQASSMTDYKQGWRDTFYLSKPWPALRDHLKIGRE